ncbi:MAG: hypothetical protein AB7I24_08950 [Candidatus Nanopelagicales bacterium]|jgi:hypothetical protein
MSRGPGYETRALLTTRRAMIVTGCAALMVALVIIGAYVWPSITAVERGLLVLAVAVSTTGCFLGRDPRGLVLAVSGLAILLLLVASSPSDVEWLPLVVLVAYPAYFTAILVPVRAAPWVAVGAGILLAALWASRPTNVVSGALQVYGGWVSVAQVVLGTLGIGLAWRLLLTQAEAADERAALVSGRRRLTESARERARAWRAAVLRVHESVLNTIRYVLAVDAVDADRLRQEIEVDLSPPAGGPGRDQRPAADLVAAMRDDEILVRRVRIVGAVPAVSVAAASWEVLRAALVELGRNAVLHGGAQNVDVSMAVPASGMLIIHVSDDGAGYEEGAWPGVGMGTVLSAVTTDLRGSWEIGIGPHGGAAVRIAVPLSAEEVATAPGAFDQGRLLVTAPLAAQSLVGFLFVLALVQIGQKQDTYGGIAAAIAIVTTVGVVVRRRLLGRSAAALLMLAPAAAPWLLVTSQWRCEETSTVAPILNLTGFCLLAVAAWSRLWPGVLGIAVWAAGALALTLEFPGHCRDAVSLALLNSLLAIPVLLLSIWVALRAYQRAEVRRAQERRAAEAEATRALVAADLDASLHGAVAEAVDLLAGVAGTGGADEAARHRLRLLDGRIRAALQVDPRAGGALPDVVRSVVEEAARRGSPVVVRALASSGDRRPLPSAVGALLVELVDVGDGPPATVQAFTDGEEDHLSFVVAPDRLDACGLRPGEQRLLGDVVVEVEDLAEPADGSTRLSVLVSRPVRPAAASASV